MGGGSIVSTFGLAKEGNTYCCKHCQTHLALFSDVVSKNFLSKTGCAYLLNNVVNVFVGMKEEKKLMTGKHIVADIFCIGCCTELGWTYETAYEKAQKYKEGKFILEKSKISKIVGPDEHNPSDPLAFQIDRLQIAGEETPKDEHE